MTSVRKHLGDLWRGVRCVTPQVVTLTLSLIALSSILVAHAAEKGIPTNSSSRTLRLPPSTPQAETGMTLPGPLGFSAEAQRNSLLPMTPLSDAIKTTNDTLWAAKWTNEFAITNIFSDMIARYRKELVDPALDPNHRPAVERLLANAMRKQADLSSNVQLWADLTQARRTKNAEKISDAQVQLVDYLAAKMEEKTGKKYSRNMSLEELMKEYKRAYGQRADSSRRTQVVCVLICLTLLPSIFFIGYKLGRRRTVEAEP